MRADPVLALSRLAGGKVIASDVFQQLLVNLSNQPKGNRKLLQTSQSVIHCCNVIHDLAHISRLIGRLHVGFGSEHVMKRTLRSFDLTRQNRFLSNVHVDEQIWIRQRLDRAIQTP